MHSAEAVNVTAWLNNNLKIMQQLCCCAIQAKDNNDEIKQFPASCSQPLHIAQLA
jgi:hypothetical protein